MSREVEVFCVSLGDVIFFARVGEEYEGISVHEIYKGQSLLCFLDRFKITLLLLVFNFNSI